MTIHQKLTPAKVKCFRFSLSPTSIIQLYIYNDFQSKKKLKKNLNVVTSKSLSIGKKRKTKQIKMHKIYCAFEPSARTSSSLHFHRCFCRKSSKTQSRADAACPL
jgi:hypothetical protein